MEAVLSIKLAAEKQTQQVKDAVDLFVAGLPSRIALEGCSVSYPGDAKKAPPAKGAQDAQGTKAKKA